MTKENDRNRLKKIEAWESDGDIFGDMVSDEIEVIDNSRFLKVFTSKSKPPNLWQLLVVSPLMPEVDAGKYVRVMAEGIENPIARINEDATMTDLGSGEVYQSLSAFAGNYGKWYRGNRDYERFDKKGHKRGKAVPNGWERVWVELSDGTLVNVHNYIVEHWNNMQMSPDDMMDKKKVAEEISRIQNNLF